MLVMGVMACSSAHTGRDAGAPDATASDVGPRIADADADGDAGRTAGQQFLPFCLRYTEVFCEANVRCCRRPDRVGDGPCAPWTELCTLIAEAPAMSDGTIVWDAEVAEMYLADVEASAPTCRAFNRYEPGHWFPLFVGTLPAGADCSPETLDRARPDALRCVPGLSCRLSGTRDVWNGVCGPPGGVDDYCNDTGVDCAPDLYCDFRVDSWEVRPNHGKCVSVAGEGEECFSDYGCTTGMCIDEGFSAMCATPLAGDDWCLWRL